MSYHELIARLEAAASALPAALGAATSILFLLVIPEVLARQTTWQDVCLILVIGAGFICSTRFCIAALRAHQEQDT